MPMISYERPNPSEDVFRVDVTPSWWASPRIRRDEALVGRAIARMLAEVHRLSGAVYRMEQDEVAFVVYARVPREERQKLADAMETAWEPQPAGKPSTSPATAPAAPEPPGSPVPSPVAPEGTVANGAAS